MPDSVTVPSLEEIQAEVTAAEERYQYNLQSERCPQAASITVPRLQVLETRQADAPASLQIGKVRIVAAEKLLMPVPAIPKFYY
jgi:hypothetical protein